ncbi:glycosyltransferase family 1 protein [Shigella boydii]|nr:glycosyltransferase family 1 protein [Shigella boydii]EGE2936439.1 glycosyltransferase family 1 protein [Shigella boydii]
MSGYPSENNLYNCSWAHTRNKYYIKNNINVDVLVFGNEEDYVFEGVSVINRAKAISRLNKKYYFKVVSHSPNIRNHIPFLSKYCLNIQKILFMHGSESMWINFDYPKPYDFMKESFWKRWVRNTYDLFKFKVMRNFLEKNKNIDIVFVSDWMRAMFEKNVISLKKLKVNFHIINNPLNYVFFERGFSGKTEKVADFITIRSFDLSKYAIDLVLKMARNNPANTFHLYGKGDYFNYYDLPENVTVINSYLRQDDIPDVLNKYRAAIMPTRCDAQGVMVCEMATFGIPVITSDITVNLEMFSDFDNVFLLDNSKEWDVINTKVLLDNFPSFMRNTSRFSNSKTLDKEIELLTK